MIKISRTGLVLEFASYKSWFMGEVRYTQRIECSIQGKLEVIKKGERNSWGKVDRNAL